MEERYFLARGRLACGHVQLAWDSLDQPMKDERKRYQGSAHGSLESVFAERLSEISGRLSSRSITVDQALAALLPAIAAYGIELSAGPITISVTAEAVEEGQEGLVVAHRTA